MKKIKILLALIIFSPEVAAQNLVPNPSFENYGILPCSWILTSSEFSQAMPDWTMPTEGSTDVFSTLVDIFCYASCSSTNSFSTGSQLPHTGDVMSEILTYGDGCGFQPDYREYLQCQLISPLVSGNSYRVEMFISLGDNSLESSNNFGMYFSSNPIGSNQCTELNATPQVNFTTVIVDQVNWVQLVDTFVAAASYEYLTIGNFYDNQNTQHIPQAGTVINAMYFVDDISVIEVQPFPVASFSADTNICTNTCIDFSDLSAGNPTSWQWLFAGATPASSTDQNPAGICYADSGLYDVTLITCNPNGCDTITVVNYISVNGLPPSPVITQSNDTLYSTSAASYQWYTGGNPIAGATDAFYIPSTEDFYSVVITNASGCNASDTIFFSPGPTSAFSVPDTSVCQKFCIDFFDQSTNNPTSWLWEFSGGAPPSSSDQNPIGICYNNPGTYDVTLITTNTFGTDTLTLNDFITVYPTPPIPSITQNGYTLTSTPGSSYQWQFNSADIPGATNQSYSVTQTGYYSVVITDENGCASSFTLYILITAIDEVFSGGNISVYPNPSDGSFIVELFNCGIADHLSIKIVNTLGQVIYSSEEKISGNGFKKEIDLCRDAMPYVSPMHCVSTGIYFIEMIAGSGSDNARHAVINQKLIFLK